MGEGEAMPEQGDVRTQIAPRDDEERDVEEGQDSAQAQTFSACVLPGAHSKRTRLLTPAAQQASPLCSA